jgi:hypothetical protein
MNSQNIKKFWGTKLDLKLDTSELYDYELGGTEMDYNFLVLDFENEIDYNSLIFDSSCITGVTLNSVKPFEFEIDTDYTDFSCDFKVEKRTEKGWTLDFVFNRDSLPWISGNTFYYWGIKNETISSKYLDNNLSFSFTTDGRIKWETYKYSGYCHTTSGYTETSYISSGQTPVMCTDGTQEDFNITITFKRYNEIYGLCDLQNYGGINDLISDYTVLNPTEVLTGVTEDISYTYTLNDRWINEKNKRLGILKIYLNGKPIYKLNNWEEIIPREYENPIVQVWGGGTNNIENLHTGFTQFNLIQVKYFKEPLSFSEINHYYKTSIKPYFNIYECNEICQDIIYGYSNMGLYTEDNFSLYTEDNNIIIY